MGFTAAAGSPRMHTPSIGIHAWRSSQRWHGKCVPVETPRCEYHTGPAETRDIRMKKGECQVQRTKDAQE